MSDFAGDFVLPPDQATTEDSKRARQRRIPDFESIRVDNPARHPIVERCIQSSAKAFAEAYESGQTRDFCLLMAQSAYLATMPDPVGDWDTRNFIACIAYGVHSHLIPQDEASRLLYAAQIALTGLQKRNV